jgi:hypothetical protein
LVQAQQVMVLAVMEVTLPLLDVLHQAVVVEQVASS